MKKRTIEVQRVMPELREMAKIDGQTVNQLANSILEEAVLHFLKGKRAAIKSSLEEMGQ